VTVHHTHLFQLLQNMILNSLKYRSPDRRPHIHISSCPGADNMLEFTVRDNGIGIASEYHETIFGVSSDCTRDKCPEPAWASQSVAASYHCKERRFGWKAPQEMGVLFTSLSLRAHTGPHQLNMCHGLLQRMVGYSAMS
jgi:hypothetical protein